MIKFMYIWFYLSACLRPPPPTVRYATIMRPAPPAVSCSEMGSFRSRKAHSAEKMGVRE